MKKYYLPTGLTLLLLIALAYSCSKSDDFLEIDNLFSSIDSKNQAPKKKGSPNVFKNHLQNLEAEIVYDGVVLQEVFCYAPNLGRNMIFLFPARGFDFNNLLPSQIVNIPGGGGGTQEQFNNAISSNLSIIIIDSVKTKCLYEVVENILHNTSLMGKMGDIINEYNLPKGRITIKIIECDTLKGYLAKWYPPLHSPTIRLNRLELPKYSKEMITSVIFHEFLHQYFTELNNKSTESQDHEEMANQGLNFTVPALVNLFPSMTELEAKAIVMSFLFNTNTYKTLNTETKDRYSQIYADYYYKKKGTFCN